VTPSPTMSAKPPVPAAGNGAGFAAPPLGGVSVCPVAPWLSLLVPYKNVTLCVSSKRNVLSAVSPGIPSVNVPDKYSCGLCGSLVIDELEFE